MELSTNNGVIRVKVVRSLRSSPVPHLEEQSGC
jgi:hypothetical protein